MQSTFLAIRNVNDGYGVNQILDDEKIFRAIGFHMGSELLADAEFTVFDAALRKKYPSLVTHLETNGTYRWVTIHTMVEMDHFDAAVKAANRGLHYYNGLSPKNEIKKLIVDGFRHFAETQEQFMAGLKHGGEHV